jgi:hypothetical protein
MSFFGSLFGGSNPTLNANIQKTGAIGDWSTGLGEKNLTAASSFWDALLSGDSSKQMAALAPEVSAAKTSAAQENKTASQFGTRSGGTAASTAATKDKVHAWLTNLIGNLTGSAAGELGSTGGSLLSTGLGAYGSQTAMSQQRMRNWANSILGHGIITSFQTGEEVGEQYLTGGTSASNAYPSGGLGN